MKEIPLTKGKIAIVDDEDYERVVNLGAWHAHWNGYDWYAANAKWLTKQTYLHRFVMNAPEGVQVDHANGNSLDCRKENLRFCTNEENSYNRGLPSNNTSGYKGVSYQKDREKWVAMICYQGTSYNLGRYDTAEEAARVYDKRAKELFGEFAWTNF